MTTGSIPMIDRHRCSIRISMDREVECYRMSLGGPAGVSRVQRDIEAAAES